MGWRALVYYYSELAWNYLCFFVTLLLRARLCFVHRRLEGSPLALEAVTKLVPALKRWDKPGANRSADDRSFVTASLTSLLNCCRIGILRWHLQPRSIR